MVYNNSADVLSGVGAPVRHQEEHSMFIKNEYYYQYWDLIKRNLNTPKGETERHHAIPVYHFQNKYNCSNRIKAIKYANKNNIIVNLSYYEHCKAHYLLCLCICDKYKYQMENAFLCMVNCNFDEDISDMFNYYAVLKRDFCKRQSDIRKRYFNNHPEAREKISKLSKLRTGSKNAFYGKHHTEEYKKQHRLKALNRNGISIKHLNTGIIYNSSREAERMIGIDHSSIIKCCKGKIKQINGNYWEYAK